MKWKLFEFDKKQMLITLDDEELRFELEVSENEDIITTMSISLKLDENYTEKTFKEKITEDTAKEMRDYLISKMI